MYTYDTPRRLPHSSPIPAMRPVRDATGSSSATPIYDALYAEYLRTFRALPGDRVGEEELGFTAFGAGPHAPGLHGSGLHGSGLHNAGLLSSGSYGSGAYTPTVYGLRQHATGLTPAALPPGPRRER
ncbi:hypothetical protein [Streptomyces sp. NPDC047070]|uniref:hypothetical protein n=1 Tax=Streptomyces sp. NPDC047070 TaxID=3154923 RepID=UPI00345304A7